MLVKLVFEALSPFANARLKITQKFEDKVLFFYFTSIHYHTNLLQQTTSFLVLLTPMLNESMDGVQCHFDNGR